MVKVYRRFISPLTVMVGYFENPFHLPRHISGLLPFIDNVYQRIKSQAEYMDFTYINTEAGHGGMGLVAHSEQMKGALQPLFEMKNDFSKTLKPYKSKTNAGRDASQPLRGLGNLLSGVMTLVLAPVFFLLMSVVSIYSLFKKDRDYLEFRFFYTLVVPLSWLVKGSLSIIRGITQIATAPLTWLIKIPLRAMITLRKGYMPVMEEAGFKSLLNLAKTNSQKKFQESSYCNPDRVHEYNASIEKTKTWVNKALHKKLLKAENQGRSIPYGLANQIHDEQQFDLVEFFLKMNRVLELLPKNLQPYCMKSRIATLSAPEYKNLVSELESVKEINQGKRFISVLVKFGLYDLEKLALLSRNNKDSTLKVIPKDVARLIAKFTILPPHEALQPNDNIVDAPVEVQVNFR